MSTRLYPLPTEIIIRSLSARFTILRRHRYPSAADVDARPLAYSVGVDLSRYRAATVREFGAGLPALSSTDYFRCDPAVVVIDRKDFRLHFLAVAILAKAHRRGGIVRSRLLDDYATDPRRAGQALDFLIGVGAVTCDRARIIPTPGNRHEIKLAINWITWTDLIKKPLPVDSLFDKSNKEWIPSSAAVTSARRVVADLRSKKIPDKEIRQMIAFM